MNKEIIFCDNVYCLCSMDYCEKCMEEKMNHRSKTNKKTDNRIFKHTAMNTKKINIKPRTSRGGIQL